MWNVQITRADWLECVLSIQEGDGCKFGSVNGPGLVNRCRAKDLSLPFHGCHFIVHSYLMLKERLIETPADHTLHFRRDDCAKCSFTSFLYTWPTRGRVLVLICYTHKGFDGIRPNVPGYHLSIYCYLFLPSIDQISQTVLRWFAPLIIWHVGKHSFACRCYETIV